MIATVLALLCVTILLLYYLITRKYDYWEKRNIPYIKPVLLFGNYASYILLQRFIGYVSQSLCRKFPNAPYIGTFYGTEPALLVQDPEVIKLILVKDFYYFNGREITNYTHREPITTNMFFTYGDRWKVMRQNLNPLFSSAKMKNMFYLIEKCARQLEKMFDEEVKQSNILKVRSVMARYTMDCIGSCVFGIETKTMEKDADKNPFTVIGHDLFLETKIGGLKMIVRSIWPAVFYGLRLRNYTENISSFFHNLLTKVFAGRDYKPTTRNDFVDLLLNLYNDKYLTGDSIENMKGGNKKISLKVDDEMLVAQCSLFFAAGFETSSTTIHFTLHELAKNPEAQAKALEEVDEYLRRHDNKIEFDCINEMPYIEACIDEVLRLYPVLSLLTREVHKEYKLPCGAVLDKGVRVHLPVYHIQRHPDFFPDPDQFRPERFLGEEKRNIKQYSYFPFGEGPRICIGMRFSKMQMLPGIMTVLKKYRVELVDPAVDLDFFATTMVITPKKEIRLKFLEREGWEQRMY
ncbi:cytochrome P450 6B5-like [Plodia interpunctella]|uniref:cytochrome P450 6B5-like n=1 Tax=Plodia interpunctella TaxID=58824 RepID=UPI002368ABDC|nr:cytochrome P450 6B5-like [Plodia interpunctella]XP_053617330.1 cytochrome P450 6B5-like [Plodia interpunctella]